MFNFISYFLFTFRSKGAIVNKSEEIQKDMRFVWNKYLSQVPHQAADTNHELRSNNKSILEDHKNLINSQY